VVPEFRLELGHGLLARTPSKKRFLISMGLSWLNKGQIKKYKMYVVKKSEKKVSGAFF
jgi:hypothetical protein